jgi:hypothetical protein
MKWLARQIPKTTQRRNLYPRSSTNSIALWLQSSSSSLQSLKSWNGRMFLPWIHDYSISGAITILFPFLHIGAPSMTTCRGSMVSRNQSSNFLPTLLSRALRRNVMPSKKSKQTAHCSVTRTSYSLIQLSCNSNHSRAPHSIHLGRWWITATLMDKYMP